MPWLSIEASVKAWKPLLDNMDLTTKLRTLKALKQASESMTPEMSTLACALLEDAEVKRALE